MSSFFFERDEALFLINLYLIRIKNIIVLFHYLGIRVK